MKRLAASIKAVVRRRKKSRGRSVEEDVPPPTRAEIEALTSVLSETGEAADRLIQSLDRYARTLNACRGEIRTATAILRESNQYAMAGRA